jgi:hypothetical protein
MSNLTLTWTYFDYIASNELDDNTINQIRWEAIIEYIEENTLSQIDEEIGLAVREAHEVVE